MRPAHGENQRTHILSTARLVWPVASVLGMSKMKTFLLIVFVLLILGPLRKPFFRSWRFNVPAVICGFAAWLMVSGSIRSHDPRWMPLAVAFFVALGGGASIKSWLDEVFGKEE